MNQIKHIPEQVKQLRCLKVLSLSKNMIETVPSCLKDFDTLRLLRLASNPLRPDFAAIFEGRGLYPLLDENATDNEKDTVFTANLKQYLRTEIAAHEFGEESSSEGPLDTPRPLVRNASLRFPIRPSGSGSESAPEAQSPGFARPPIPARSHFRVASGQYSVLQKTSLRRPGLAPLNIGNERNRSNSESILQATQNNRSKRMGMVPKKDLGTVEEKQPNRSSFHLRGQSHASALSEWSHEPSIDNADIGDIKISKTSRESSYTSGRLLRRLTKVPKPKTTAEVPSKFVESTKDGFHFLHSFQLQTPDLITRLKSGTSKRSRLERADHHAEFLMTGLHRAITQMEQQERSVPKVRKSKEKSSTLTKQSCNSALTTCLQLGRLLHEQASPIILAGKRRDIRAFSLYAFGSSTEARQALAAFQTISKRRTITQKRFVPGSIIVQQERQALRDQSLTPTRDRPVTAKRMRTANAFQPLDFTGTGNTRQVAGPQSTISVAQPSVPLYINGRSRSNSRADSYNLPSSTSSSFAMTPSSTEHFSVPGTPLNRSRSSSVAAGAQGGRLTPASSYLGTDTSGHQAQFDKICQLLQQTILDGRRALPQLNTRFMRSLDLAQTQDRSQGKYEAWSQQVRRCHKSLELTEIMAKRLRTVKYHEPESHAEKGFWELCKKFLAEVGDLLTGIREAYNERLVGLDIVRTVRLLSKASKEASREVNDSPWSHLLNPQGSMLPPAIPSGHRYRRSSGSNSSSYMASIPATPLSAALGPAAQATVPSTPASGALERSFHGGLMERADALLQSQQNIQTMVRRAH